MKFPSTHVCTCCKSIIIIALCTTQNSHNFFLDLFSLFNLVATNASCLLPEKTRQKTFLCVLYIIYCHCWLCPVCAVFKGRCFLDEGTFNILLRIFLFFCACLFFTLFIGMLTYLSCIQLQDKHAYILGNNMASFDKYYGVHDACSWKTALKWWWVVTFRGKLRLQSFVEYSYADKLLCWVHMRW